MMFNESSDLAGVFSNARGSWLKGIRNEDLRRLIYVILSWRESIRPPLSFESLLAQHLSRDKNGEERERLKNLQSWHSEFAAAQMFHPFMSDIIGNTICADLMDYLFRDRLNLGMEPRLHARLQRYFTIRPGTLYPREGLRMSIMVTRKGRGGQRKDVATAVLDVMRERYEMAERVFYHHKKAAASAMLAKLVELAGPRKPRDDDRVYPAPWQEYAPDLPSLPHVCHMSDAELIDYLAKVDVAPAEEELQSSLSKALRFRRAGMYRTLLVVDTDMIHASSHSVPYLAEELRGSEGSFSSEGRASLEAFLAREAQASPGDVIVYCPSPKMQSKEVDARLEIVEDRVLPLRVQTESFVYQSDVEVLQKYYEDLWRAYVFVSPRLFKDGVKCRSLVQAFCRRYGIREAVGYMKVRGHNFSIVPGVTVKDALSPIQRFLEDLPFKEIPRKVASGVLGEACEDQEFLKVVQSGADPRERLSSLFEVSALDYAISKRGETKALTKSERARVERYTTGLLAGEHSARPAARGTIENFEDYALSLLTAALEQKTE
jgi:hypothetical protein